MSARPHDEQFRVSIGGDPSQSVGDRCLQRHLELSVVYTRLRQQLLDTSPCLVAGFSSIEAAFPGWIVTDVEVADAKPDAIARVLKFDEHWYRLRRE